MALMPVAILAVGSLILAGLLLHQVGLLDEGIAIADRWEAMAGR